MTKASSEAIVKMEIVGLNVGREIKSNSCGSLPLTTLWWTVQPRRPTGAFYPGRRPLRLLYRNSGRWNDHQVVRRDRPG
jgi:hypothetical protein